MSKPIINYYGGKRKDAIKIVPLIKENLPDENTYIEPFVGAGAIWLALNHDKNIIGDIIPDLINMYECIQNNPEKVLNHLEHLKNNEEYFYKIRNFDRTENFDRVSKYFKAARYIYLTICSYGTVTFNKNGQANQSYFKRPERVITLNQYDYISLAELLQKTEVKLSPFEETMKLANENDFVYLDPPYIESRYDRYYKDRFTFKDMERLKACCDDLTERGVKFALSHSENEKVDNLFKDYNIRDISVSRDIIKLKNYSEETDYLITNF